MKDYFSPILDSDEKIIETLRPNKFKFIYSALMIYGIIALVIVAVATLIIIFPIDGGNAPKNIIFDFIPLMVGVLGFIVTGVLVTLWYKNVFYCYTNKRIIIRCGIFGEYFRFLDLKTIGAVDVTISAWDKAPGKATGTIRFGSLASPMVPNSGIYAFEHVEEPYETYRKIKTYIDDAQK